MQTKENLRHQKRMEQIRKIQQKQKHRAKQKQALEKYAPKKKKRLSTSKVFVIGIFVVALQVIIFSEIFMWHTMDSSSLYALIGIAASVATMSASLLGYFGKAKAENTQGGIVYDQAMQEYTPPIDTIAEDQTSDEDAVG